MILVVNNDTAGYTTIAPNIIAQLNQCWEKNVSTSNVRKRWLYDRNTIKKPLLRKQNNVRRSQCGKAIKDWIVKQWNSSLD